MIYEYDLLPEDVIKDIKDLYEFSDFTKGIMLGEKKHSSIVKNNIEMIPNEHYPLIRSTVYNYIVNNWEIYELLGIRKMSGVICSKYETGMFYNYHNDNVVMNGIRSDYSATCFISSPDEYDGGELELTVGNQKLSYKLDSGKVLIYPTGLLHRVKEVTRGTRKVLVFWLETTIQDPGIREITAKLGHAWYKYKDKLLEETPELYDAILNAKFQLQRQFGNYEGL